MQVVANGTVDVGDVVAAIIGVAPGGAGGVFRFRQPPQGVVGVMGGVAGAIGGGEQVTGVGIVLVVGVRAGIIMHIHRQSTTIVNDCGKRPPWALNANQIPLRVIRIMRVPS